MRTSKAFSTISYNSSDFLKIKLGELVERRKIAFYAFIEHLPEDDEKKAHKHLFVVPNGQVNTDEVLDYLTEIDLAQPDKPLRCIAPHSSKFGDWFLYALHDKGYLASKGQARKYAYKQEELQCSDTDYLNEEVHQIDYSRFSKVKALISAIDDGVSIAHLLEAGLIPIQQINCFKTAYDLVTTERNGRKGHQAFEIADDDGLSR